MTITRARSIGYTLFPKIDPKIAEAILDRTDSERISTATATKTTKKKNN